MDRCQSTVTPSHWFTAYSYLKQLMSWSKRPGCRQRYASWLFLFQKHFSSVLGVQSSNTTTLRRTTRVSNRNRRVSLFNAPPSFVKSGRRENIRQKFNPFPVLGENQYYAQSTKLRPTKASLYVALRILFKYWIVWVSTDYLHDKSAVFYLLDINERLKIEHWLPKRSGTSPCPFLSHINKYIYLPKRFTIAFCLYVKHLSLRSALLSGVTS